MWPPNHYNSFFPALSGSARYLSILASLSVSVGCEWWYAEYLEVEIEDCESCVALAITDVHLQPVDPDGGQILHMQRDQRIS